MCQKSMWVKSRGFVGFWLLICLVLALVCWLGAAHAADKPPPRAALKYKQQLIRIAHSVWGLDAPIPAFAAQITQESAWMPNAVSWVGARGMAQFMPGTSKWWCERNKISKANCLPNNPTWAMRAMIGYDLFLYKRVHAYNEYDRLWAALRSYNGGLGHWRKEARVAKSSWRFKVDAACGKARRHRSHCKENLSYPKRILNLYQPRYVGWGRIVTMGGGSL